MSSHWKSTPKYWCKHCTVYVKDTPFERKQHEATGKHQGNLKRSLSTIQKDHARNEREKDRAKAEVERLNRITDGATSGLSGKAQTAAPSKSSNISRSSAVLSASDQKRQWAQLAEMGIAIPEHARAEMAMAGEWQVMSRQTVIDPSEHTEDKLNVGVHKRKSSVLEESELNSGETPVKKAWGTATKSYPGATPVTEDLATLLARPIVKRPKNSPEPSLSVLQDQQENFTTTMKKEPSEITTTLETLPVSDSDLSNNLHPESAVKSEDTDNKVSLLTTKTADDGDHMDSGPPIFKKRKPKRAPTQNV